MHAHKQTICKQYLIKFKSYFTLSVLLRRSWISKLAVDLLSQAHALHTNITDR